MHPTLIFIDIDKFKSVNSVVRPDRRRQPAADGRAAALPRHLGDTIRSRASAAISSRCCCWRAQDPRELAMLAERVRRIAAVADQDRRPGHRADGLDRHRRLRRPAGRRQTICCATPRSRCTAPSAAAPTASRSSSREMRAERDDRVAIESDLRRAIEKRQLTRSLSADHLSADRGTGRLRGAGALGAPKARHAQPGRVHSGRRGERPDRQARLATC